MTAARQYKVALSPEDRSSNVYHAAALYNGRPTDEREQMRRLADLLETALTRCGFAVKNMQYGNMYARVRDANAWGADLYIALHTNGFDGAVAGTRVHCYPSEASRRMGKLLQDAVAPLSPGKSDGLKVTAALYELRAPRMPAVLPEYGFHDNAAEAAWLVESIPLLAEVTCRAVCEFFGAAYAPACAPADGGALCAVSVPALASGARGDAVAALQTLLALRGFPCGSADGVFGPGTRRALEALQRARALAVTGTASSAEWAALLAAGESSAAG